MTGQYHISQAPQHTAGDMKKASQKATATTGASGGANTLTRSISKKSPASTANTATKLIQACQH